ncbi:IS3 family transposase [Pseudomonas sp. L7]|uniref:IS3 family transposase n=1 Tax=Pseudomonas sp. L7 TaxID=3388343 RepID=UPI00398524D5
MKLVSECFSVARSQLAVRIKQSASPKVRRSRLVKGAELVAEIQQQVSELPNYGCRRVWGLLRRARETRSLPAINVKRVYRVMRDYNLLPDRRIKQPSVPRRKEGRIPCKPAIRAGARTALSSTLWQQMIGKRQRYEPSERACAMNAQQIR